MKSNYWIYGATVVGGLVLGIIITLSLIAGLVHWKNEARKETETEISNVLYGMDYYEGSKITETNPSYVGSSC